MLITEREDVKPLRGMDWLREFVWTIPHIKKIEARTDQSEREDKNTQFERLFKMNRTNKHTEIKIQLKPHHLPMKKKARPILYHSQNYVEKEMNNLIKS